MRLFNGTRGCDTVGAGPNLGRSHWIPARPCASGLRRAPYASWLQCPWITWSSRRAALRAPS